MRTAAKPRLGRARKTAGAIPRSRIMRDFPAFWIVFTYGVIQLENPQKFRIGLANLKIFVISQKLYTNWMGPPLRVEPIGARVAPRCCAAKRGPSTRFEQTRPRPSKLVHGRAAHPRHVICDTRSHN